MSSGTGYASVPGSQSSTNPAVKLKQEYIDHAASIHIASSAVSCCTVDYVLENVYSGTLVGSRVIEQLEKYSYFQFQVIGVDADDDISIAISLDGLNFVTIPVINIATGAEIAAGTNIGAAGMYRYGNEPTSTSLRDAPVALGVKAIKVTRETATGANQVDVIMRAI